MPFRILNINENQGIITCAVQQKIRTEARFSLADYLRSAKEYYYSISTRDFKALVVDFDNTIHNKRERMMVEADIKQFLNEMLRKGIIIGIATGNGEYITEDLREYFDSKYHSAILVGYYNCGIITSLDKDVKPLFGFEKVPLEFRLLKKYYYDNNMDEFIIAEGFESNNPYELNFFTEAGDIGVYNLNRLKEFITARTSLKILDSPHSFDVIPTWISKLDLCKYLSIIGISQDEILTMGDCGAQGESDYELLCRQNSLSVNSISNALYSCWKFTPTECINLDATWYYLKTVEFV